MNIARINSSFIKEYSEKYDELDKYLNVETKIKKELVKRKPIEFLAKDEFLQIGNWKSPRQRKNYNKNSDELIHDVTNISFSNKNEQIRIEVLTILKGVYYPVASTILHFAFPNKYPILDFRALETLNINKPNGHNFDFWWNFVLKTRTLSKNLGVSIRQLDKALWAYSKIK